MKVVCSKRQTCKHRETCGGAKPHQWDETECNKCPMDATAECLPVPAGQMTIAKHIAENYEKEEE